MSNPLFVPTICRLKINPGLGNSWPRSVTTAQYNEACAKLKVDMPNFSKCF